MSERGNYSGHVAKSSIYTKAALHPVAAAAFLVGAAVAAAAIVGEAIAPKKSQKSTAGRIAELFARR